MSAIIEERHIPNISKFVFVSIILHLAWMTTNALIPKFESVPEKKPPVKVKFIEPEKPKPEEKVKTFIDSPKPNNTETPKVSDLIAANNSRAHSNQLKKKISEYRRNETVVPKVRSKAVPPSKAKKAQKVQKRQRKAEPAPESVKEAKKYRLSDKGYFTREPKMAKEEETENKKKQAGSALAFLDGFDAKKFAKMNTSPDEEGDDDQPISLNTTEVKYASYFARIKHQIERVWAYPEEAARRGESGEITLRFQISKDGNLVGVYLVDASGSQLLDSAAMKAVKGAAPFYPFPLTITKEKLSILATFIYSPTYGAHRRR
ncbi:MAG: energy transducer TonB [Nitrospinales bacterium]